MTKNHIGQAQASTVHLLPIGGRVESDWVESDWVENCTFKLAFTMAVLVV